MLFGNKFESIIGVARPDADAAYLIDVHLKLCIQLFEQLSCTSATCLSIPFLLLFLCLPCSSHKCTLKNSERDTRSIG